MTLQTFYSHSSDNVDEIISKSYVAHVRKLDGEKQSVKQHLLSVSEIAGQLAEKIGLKDAGELIGLLHDFGKYSKSFQNYIQSATGVLNSDLDDDFVDSVALKGKIDHSSAGAQWIWQALSSRGKNGEGALCAQVMALCIASHHSGLIDCLKPEGGNGFAERMNKADVKTHLAECKLNADALILDKATVLADVSLLKSMLIQLRKVLHPQPHSQTLSTTIKYFYLGFLTRFLFSCLIDADRVDSADFERPQNKRHRRESPVNWQVAVDRMEAFIETLKVRHKVDEIRRDISDCCKAKASGAQGIYSLTVPTGGGKTYASLRFALHHAQKHGLDRVIYIVPYTTIIEQNAKAIRAVVERENDEFPWVLEHHSNLEPEQQTWRSKLVAENWDSPIVLTTMVQFLETLFSGGTRGVRRMHQLANSVIVFDEIQTLPINCTHLFCNALNFLTTHTKTTAVLCTATQPLLHRLKNADKGQLFIPENNELVHDVESLFRQLERVSIKNKVRVNGWSDGEITELAIHELNTKGSCLIIVNTKAWAKKLYESCAKLVEAEAVFHLSTSQCPTHRQLILERVRSRLDNDLPVLCVSTQLIEAGVDVDFSSVIRFLAGLDSVAQAAGRCNRNGERGVSEVHLLNPNQESIDTLVDIKVGQEKMRRILDESVDGELLTPPIMKKYFDYYFYSRADEMDYQLSVKQASRTDSLLNLLSDNPRNLTAMRQALLPELRQSFMTAGKAFKAIDAPTESVIVPYGEGKQLIVDLGDGESEFNIARYYTLLKKAQKFSVNVFPNVWQKLVDADAVHEIKIGEGVYCLDGRYYSEAFGLSTEIVSKADFLSL